MFQKKILVAAVAGALGAGAAGTAFAQTTVGTVEIYGRLYPEFTVGSSSGATPAGASSSTLGAAPTGLNHKSRNSVDASNSRLGFRGTENLGGGLSAIWQIENQVDLTSGASNPLAARDSFVGLKGGFGTVKLGNMETVFKYLGDPLGILGVSSGNFVSTSNVISSRVAFGTSSAGSFHLRRANSVLYQSPELGGFTVHAMYSPDEIRTGNNLNADLWAVGLEYKRGPIEASLAHEIHNDLFAGSNGAAAVANPTTGAIVHSKDKGTRGTIAYRYAPGGILQANYATVTFDESGGAAGKFKDYSNDRWSLTWEHRWNTQWRSSVAYANANSGSCSLVGVAPCTTNGLGANMWVLGGDYSFSRRTALFLLYAKLTNNSASQQRNAENWTPTPGADISQYSVGIRHNY